MIDMKLPADLIAFFQASRELEYDPTTCEAGSVTLLPLEELNIELFPIETGSLKCFEQDPHYPKRGSYLVTGVNLVSDCTNGYEGVGLLLWLPVEERYATWDNSHCLIAVFGPEVTWSHIAAAPAAHLNAQWSGIDPTSPATSALIPWPNHRYSERQVYDPLPAD